MHTKKIKQLGDGVPYLDGAESELLAIMRVVNDRSVGSDELASYVKDWPTEYHLSRARANLLKPFNLPPGTRVLDIGCGTGALVRQFAEWGNQVTGLEGSYSRCEVASERVREFNNAEIICGSLDEYKSNYPNSKFDFIILCGVLEYSGARIGGSAGPEHMLKTAATLLADSGVLVVAIENKLGLKYLSGHNEDHLGKPLVGLQNYLNENVGVRTWSRKELEQIIRSSGLNSLKWFAPFPDYKTPTVIVSEDLFRHDDGAIVAKNFIRMPIYDRSAPPAFDLDLVSFWQSFLDVSSPLELANSFLFAATKTKMLENKYLSNGVLWTGNENRKKQFDNSKTLEVINDEFELTNHSHQDLSIENLVFRSKKVDLLIGENLEDFLIEKLRNTDLPEALDVFSLWWDLAEQLFTQTDSLHNFDILPRNFVRNEQGAFEFIDYEWYWNESLPKQVVMLRALYYLFNDRIFKIKFPFLNNVETLRNFALLFGNRINLELQDHHFNDAAEFTMQIENLVSGVDINLGLRNFNESFTKKISDHQGYQLLTRYERDQLLHELDNHKLLNKILSDRLTAIKVSLSWRLTKPLRVPKRLIKKVQRMFKRIRFRDSGR